MQIFSPIHITKKSWWPKCILVYKCKIIEKMTNNNKINDTYKESGQILMAPIITNFNKTGRKRSRKVGIMGQLANRVQVTSQAKLSQISKSKFFLYNAVYFS